MAAARKAEPCKFLTYVDHTGQLACITASGGTLLIPAEFKDALQVLSNDLLLALDCIEAFGGVPLPVAQAILRNIEPTHTALDLAFKTSSTPRKETHVDLNRID